MSSFLLPDPNVKPFGALDFKKPVDAAADEPIILPPPAKKAKIEVQDKDRIEYDNGISNITEMRSKLWAAQKALEDAELSFAKTYYHKKIKSCDSDSFDKIVKFTEEFEAEKSRIYKRGRFGTDSGRVPSTIRLHFPYEK